MNIREKWHQLALSLVLVLFVTLELPVIAVGYLTKPEPADVMIVLGSRVIGREPGPMLRLRLEEAARLYHQGFSPAIIVSGARGDDEEIAEAEAMRDYLVGANVPPDRIILEAASFNTYQNLANSRAVMAARQYKTALIVSNASHIRRSLAIARSLGMEASGAPAPMAGGLYLQVKQYLREGAAMFTLAFSP